MKARLDASSLPMEAWLYAIVLIVPASVLIGHGSGGAWHWLTPLIVFGIIPVLDHLIGVDTRNPFPDKPTEAPGLNVCQAITWLCAPVQIGLVVWGAEVISGGTTGWIESIGLTVSVGISSGILGINASHELQHRVNHPAEIWLSRLMLLTVGYMHWAIEHVIGHHRHVATPRDPATARLGESFYRFLPRTIVGGFQSAWMIEEQGLARAKKAPLSHHNRILRYGLAQILFVALLVKIFGWAALPYWLLQSAVAVVLLEVINYVEHYGLRRQRRGQGYAPVEVRHSWNASYWLTNHFLFNLQRHADHHYRPGRRYPYLRHFKESPQLPTGYAGMILLAVVPPVWRRVMDKRVCAIAHQK
jgi:alkane 1-monooxygenase